MVKQDNSTDQKSQSTPLERDRDALDHSHESNSRGEHRYPDEHQRPAERQARQDRDELKKRLGQRPARHE
jgi:hypothetical protein